MILVETSNSIEQTALEEEFNRKGKFFTIPSNKLNTIQNRVESIFFQVLTNNKNKQTKAVQEGPTFHSQLVIKILQLLKKMLNHTISLTCIRQIFQLIKLHERKMTLYQEHILMLNKLILDEEDQHFDFYEQQLEEMFQQALQSKGKAVATLQDDLEGNQNQDYQNIKKIYSQASLDNQVNQNHFGSKEQVSIQENDSKEEMQGDSMQISLQQNNLLSGQLTQNVYSPHCSIQSILNKRNSCITDSDQSQNYHYSSHKKRLSTPKSTELSPISQKNIIENEILYRPLQKIEQMKKMNNILAKNKDKKMKQGNQDNSAYISDISGRFKPKVSVLNDTSLTKTIIKEIKQDVWKSDIIRQSIQGGDCEKNNVLMYEKNIKMAKMKNKLNHRFGNKRKNQNNHKNIQSQKQFMKNQGGRVKQNIKQM